MKVILKIGNLYLPNLNNAEYTNLMSRVRAEVEVATSAKLGITDEDLAAFDENIKKMQDLVGESRISDDTARLAATDLNRDKLVVYLLDEVKLKQKSPNTDVRAASISLYNAIRVFRGIQRLPTLQETEYIRALIKDCRKAENMAHLTLLGLDFVIEQLEQANSKYALITDHRTQSRVASRIESSQTVRAANDPLYDYILTMAFAVSVATPSDEASFFIQQINAIIKEINTLNKMRVGKSKSKTKESKQSTPKNT